LRVSSRDKQHHDFWCQRCESQIVHRWFNHRDVGGHVEAGAGFFGTEWVRGKTSQLCMHRLICRARNTESPGR
jgi:hypothetical protein